MKKLLLIAAVGFGSGSCTSMAPKYERPAAPIPAQLDGGTGSASARDLKLADFVKDDKLRRLLGQVVSQNRTLRRAASDIESARALYRIQRQAWLPDVNASANVTSTRQFTGIPGAESVKFTIYGANVGVTNWEIDLWGKLRSQTDAKLQSYLATVEAARAGQIALIGEVCTAYVAYAADRSRLKIAQDTMGTAKKAMDLTEALVGGGTANRSDFWNASTVFEQARGDVAAITAQIQQDRNAIELLAGGHVDDALLPDALPDGLDWFADVPVGMSSAVLLERPDVLAAEHELEAANANIGAARAQFFPSLVLTASGGIASLALSTLFSGPTAVYTLAPSLVMPLFRHGANKANLAFTEAQKTGLVAAYEYAIQTAFREVADALAVRSTIDQQLEAQKALVEAATKGFELSQARYQAGIDPFLTTLVSERTLYGAQSSLVATRQAALSNRVAMYRVLGGGLQ